MFVSVCFSGAQQKIAALVTVYFRSEESVVVVVVVVVGTGVSPVFLCSECTMQNNVQFHVSAASE